MAIEELAVYPQWVVCYLVDKVPLNPHNGNRAAVNDSTTWATYEVAAACCATNPFLTLGFVLTSNDPFICIDLDTYKTFDSEIIELHKRIYETCNSYSELSPNGGVHIWLKGALAAGHKESKQFWEVYPFGRYITVTGKSINNEPIQERQSILDQIKIKASAPADSPDGAQTQTDEQVIKAAAFASNGELFQGLYMGQWQKFNYPSQSEADLAFLNIVAFYSDSKEQVARIYYASELFKNTPKDKKKRKSKRDYLFHANYGLITKAFDQKNPVAYFTELEGIIKAKCDEEARRLINVPIMPGLSIKEQLQEQLPEFVKKELTDFTFDELPPGIVGELARFIYQNAVRPVKEIAISAAIAYFAGIAGKAYNISRTGLNHYIAILAPTAGGKEGAASGMEQMTKYIVEKFPPFEQFIGPGEIASPQALIKHLSTVSPCFIAHKGEVGFWMQKLTNKWAKANELQLRALLLDLYTKSGQGQVVRGSIYSDKTKDVHAIKSPAFTLFGDATPDTFYKALDEENVEEGLVARFTVVEATGERTEYNKQHGTIKPSPILVDKMIGIAKRAMQLAQINNVIEVQETPDATAEHMKFMEECYARAFEDRDSAEGKLYSRAHLRLLRLAALIAVGINPDVPVMTVDCIRWARAFIVHGIAAVAARFEAGRVGEINYVVEQRLLLMRCLKNYWRSGYHETYGSVYGINKEMYDVKVITNRYIQNNVTKHIGFRKDRNPLLAYKNIVQEFVDNGVLERIDMGKIKDSPRRGIAYYIRDIERVVTN
jgi:hypothetical protein